MNCSDIVNRIRSPLSKKRKSVCMPTGSKDRLVFDNDCLADILISMEGRYNMDIECPKQFAASTHLSFTIRQESIEEVMEAMSLIAPIRYEMKMEKYILYQNSIKAKY